MPPWHPHVTEAEIAEAGGESMASFVGKDGAWRFATALDAFNQHRANNMGAAQHWETSPQSTAGSLQPGMSSQYTTSSQR